MKINNGDADHLNKAELERLLNLLERYLSDQCTDDEKVAVRQWYESLSGERETKISEELELKSKIWDNVRLVTDSVHEESSMRIAKTQHIGLRWAAAISILCLSCVFAYLYFKKEQSSSPLLVLTTQKDWIINTNTTSLAQNVVLPDGSQVKMQPDASIGYPLLFSGDERLIHFTGDAFFDIEKDETKPFKVITGNIITRVLGTSFNVKANDQSSVVEVDVRTGRVSVYEHTKTNGNKSDGVILTPNQKVTYYKKENKWVTELVHDPIPVISEAEKISALVFKDILVRNVLQDVASIYSIEIIVANEGIYDCTFTGDVSQMELYDMLEVICKSIRATYEVRGTRILINGEGCIVK